MANNKQKADKNNEIKSDEKDQKEKKDSISLEANKKVIDLLKDLPLSSDVKKQLGIFNDEKENLLEFDDVSNTNAPDLLNQKTNDDSIEWLQSELNKATEELEKVKGELKKSKEDYQKLFNSKINTVNPVNNLNSNSIQKLREYMNDLELTMLGKNPKYPNQQYVNVPIKFLLNKLVEIFPNLFERK